MPAPEISFLNGRVNQSGKMYCNFKKLSHLPFRNWSVIFHFFTFCLSLELNCISWKHDIVGSWFFSPHKYCVFWSMKGWIDQFNPFIFRVIIERWGLSTAFLSLFSYFFISIFLFHCFLSHLIQWLSVTFFCFFYFCLSCFCFDITLRFV